jgi:O-antigen/teichoic acid export membrane protein
LASKFLKNSIFGAVAGLLTTIGSFACGLIVARVLGVHASGTVSYSIWLAGTIATISGLGFSSTIARFLPELIARGEADQAAALTVYLFKILAGAVFTVVLIGILAAAIPFIRNWLPPAADDTPNFWLITAFSSPRWRKGAFS